MSDTKIIVKLTDEGWRAWVPTGVEYIEAGKIDKRPVCLGDVLEPEWWTDKERHRSGPGLVIGLKGGDLGNAWQGGGYRVVDSPGLPCELDGPAWVKVDDDEAICAIGEGVHAGLRKGSEAEDADRLWRMISDSSDSQSSAWADAVSFCVWGLGAMGLAVCRREKDQGAPDENTAEADRAAAPHLNEMSAEHLGEVSRLEAAREALEDSREMARRLKYASSGEDWDLCGGLIAKITKALEGIS